MNLHMFNNMSVLIQEVESQIKTIVTDVIPKFRIFKGLNINSTTAIIRLFMIMYSTTRVKLMKFITLLIIKYKPEWYRTDRMIDSDYEKRLITKIIKLQNPESIIDECDGYAVRLVEESCIKIDGILVNVFIHTSDKMMIRYPPFVNKYDEIIEKITSMVVVVTDEYTDTDITFYSPSFANSNAFSKGDFEAWTKQSYKTTAGPHNTFINDTVQDFVDDLQKFIDNKKEYRRTGKPYNRTYLCWGEPGTSKSYTVSIFFSGIPIYKIDESLMKDAMAFRSAMKQAHIDSGDNPYILFFDEFDKMPLIYDLECYREHKLENSVTMSQFLTFLNGPNPCPNRIVIMTANNIDTIMNYKVCEPLRRPGRIHRIFQFGLCSHEQILKTIELRHPDWNAEHLADTYNGIITPAFLNNVMSEDDFKDFDKCKSEEEYEEEDEEEVILDKREIITHKDLDDIISSLHDSIDKCYAFGCIKYKDSVNNIIYNLRYFLESELKNIESEKKFEDKV